jgi:hypothetical protein
MDYIITNSESQSHTPIITDWVTSTSYQLKFIFTYKK